MPRVMCVHFPSWSLQRSRHQRPELRNRPFAVTRPGTNKGCKLVACCSKARRQGVRPGMLQAEALATLPTLICVDEDLDADRQALTQLAEWSLRFSPIVGLEDAIAPTCLFIDTTGGDACFGGEERLLRKARDEFNKSGWIVAIALADTIGAAWGISQIDNYQLTIDNFQLQETSKSICNCQLSIVNCQCTPSRSVLVPVGEHPQWLRKLPVAALRLSERALSLLGQLGIERIEQLESLPRDQVAERFGSEIGLRLDQALGRAPEVIAPFHSQPEATASWAFDDPIDRHDIVLRVLDLLLDRLQGILEQRHIGTRLVECVFELDGAEALRLECSLSRPARTAGYLRPLLHTRLEQLRMPAPIRAICVRAVILERMLDEQGSLFADSAASAMELAHLLDSLVARLGRDAVTTARFVADFQPERACRFDCALESDNKGTVVELPEFVHRPLRVLPRPIAIQVIALMPYGTPQRFRHAGVDHTVVHCQGPERIETGWWRGDDIRRDYYIVETREGSRWWIFQRVDDGYWFLQGCFD